MSSNYTNNGSNGYNSYHASLDRQGFVVIPSIVSPAQLISLRSSSAHIVSLARAGKWPHLRTLPKQFPPWSSDPSHGIWGVQHLLKPDMPNQHIFAESYFSSRICSVVCDLMDCTEDELVMELYNLLIRPDRDFELIWHRDDIPPTATSLEEERRLCADKGMEREYAHAQWNLALYEDSSLVVVPGSHRRARTETERAAGPYDELLDGMLVVKLQPGDAVFYDNNILHRGVYKADKERMTLHGSVGRSGKGDERARNVFQHGVGDWVQGCNFSALDGAEDDMGKRAEAMRGKLVEMGRGRGRAVEYSQPELHTTW